jgi:hypothetical protein
VIGQYFPLFSFILNMVQEKETKERRLKQFFIKPRPGSIACSRTAPPRSRSPNFEEMPTSKTNIELSKGTVRPRRMVYSAQESGYLNRSRYNTSHHQRASSFSQSAQINDHSTMLVIPTARFEEDAPASFSTSNIHRENLSRKDVEFKPKVETPPELQSKTQRPKSMAEVVLMRKKIASCSSSTQQRAKTGIEIRQTAFDLERKIESAKPQLEMLTTKSELDILIKSATARQKESRQLTGSGKRFQQLHESRTPRHETQVNASEFRLTQENFRTLEGEFRLMKRSRATKTAPENDEATRANIPYLLYHDPEISGIPKGWQSNVGDETRYTTGHLAYCNAKKSKHLTCSCHIPFGARILG